MSPDQRVAVPLLRISECRDTRLVDRLPRPVVGALVAAATAATAGGLWLQAAGDRAAPSGFVQYSAVAGGTAALGGFILWHRPRNRYGLAHLVIGVLFGTVVLAAGVLTRAGTPAALPASAADVALAWSWLAAGALLPLWVVVLATFPDGRFHRAAARRGTVALSITTPVLATVAYLLAPPGEPPPLIQVALPAHLVGPLAAADDPHVLHRLASTGAAILGSLAPLAAVVALLDRFRKAGPVVRQQIKWLLLGAAVSVVLQAIPVEALDSQVLRTTARVLVVMAVPLPLLAAAMAISKHRLWDIDVVISKGLVYALASGVLTALFFVVALIAGVTVGGRDSRVLAALGLALLVSFLAQPLRRRLETVVARVLYGDHPRGVRALARLGDVGARPLDARALGARIADVARHGLGASWAGVWLCVGSEGSGTVRPLAVSGAEPGPSAVLPHAVLIRLADLPGAVRFAHLSADVAQSLLPSFPGAPAAIVPLTSSGSLIGLIACGARPKGAYGDEDLELLAVVAHESALALRNIGLEEELRQQLEQIEQQAAELHSSRQRLVTAQDQERRRIERDLHDGAQQQLVALAARLRRAARADGTTGGASLEELADEAEEAVFTLQELARGIYPSLLADRGLHAALQAHAARLPTHVRVEVEPLLHGRRLEPELEAALYFVGLEAMTNAVKHAPGASVIVSLRADRQARTVTLEVHDDGPGLRGSTPTTARGLQNMADRMAALGGVLTVESAPGGGTWVRAEVEARAAVTDLRTREATS